jgi:hypothetical protein
MTDVRFDEERQQSFSASASRRSSPLIALVLRSRLARTERGAGAVLLCAAIACFSIALAVLGSAFGWFSHPQPTYFEDVPAQVRAGLPPDIVQSLPHRPAHQ